MNRREEKFCEELKNMFIEISNYDIQILLDNVNVNLERK